MQGTHTRFTGKVQLDEEAKKFTFVTEMAGVKQENVTVTFDRIAKLVRAYGENVDGFTVYPSKTIEFSTDQILEYADIPYGEVHLFECLYPMHFTVEDGILTIVFAYIKNELINIYPKE